MANGRSRGIRFRHLIRSPLMVGLFGSVSTSIA